MLIVLAKAKVGIGAMEAARTAIADMVAASNAEEGCYRLCLHAGRTRPVGASRSSRNGRTKPRSQRTFATPHMAAFRRGNRRT